MTIEDSVEDDVLRQLIGASLNHHDGVLGTCNRQVQRGNLALLFRRVDDELIIHTADTNAGNRAHERDIRNRQSCRSTDHSSKFRSIVLFNGQNRCHDLNIIAETFREQRTNRTVDESCAENGIARRTALAFDKAARNLTGSIHLLLIVNRQREEVYALARFSGSRSRNQHYRIAIANQCRTICLFRHLAVLNDELAATQFHFETLHESIPPSMLVR